MTTQEISPSIDPAKRVLVRPRVTASNAAGLNTVVRVRHMEVMVDEPKEKGGSDLAPTPLETVLSGLVGCEGVIIHAVAKAIGFQYDRVEFECEGVADLRGARGVRGIRPYFESVRLVIDVRTDEPEKRFDLLQRNVELRCPVMNLFRDAGVSMEIEWRATPQTSNL